MNKFLFLTLFVAFGLGMSASAQQDKSKRVSPPAQVTMTTKKGVTVTINYSQPSVKGRTIGKEIAPYGKVWRTGANEATTFELNKPAKIEGKELPAGKYSLYTIPGEKEWVIIFNKTWNQWGTVYNEADDQLRVTVKPEKSETIEEKMTFAISKGGEVSLLWGDVEVEFEIK
jgi:hypothetical protein